MATTPLLPAGLRATAIAFAGAMGILPLLALAFLPQSGGRWLVFGAPGPEVALVDHYRTGMWLVDAPDGLSPAEAYDNGAWLVLDAGVLIGCGVLRGFPSMKDQPDV